MPREQALIVRLEIVAGRGLSERDKSLKYWHLADPYCVVKLVEGGGGEVVRFETVAVRATLAPEWEECFCFRVAGARDPHDEGRLRPARSAFLEVSFGGGGVTGWRG